MNDQNQNWGLETFVQILTAELDRMRDVLRVKSVNRPLTYSVQDVKLDLNVFPDFDGEKVSFRTARPNETGASKLALQLGSITDRIVDETTRPPLTGADKHIDEVPIPDDTKKSLRRLGIDSKRDVDRLGRQGVKVRTDDGGEVDFARLATMMDQVLLPPRRPVVRRAVAFPDQGGTAVRISGDALDAIDPASMRLGGSPVTASITPRVIALSLPQPVRPIGELVFTTFHGQPMRVTLE